MIPLASATSFVTDAVTGAIGDHGVYAVFGLMLVDAVLPAFSELVMVYAGALAAGAFAGKSVVLFGDPIETEWRAFVTMVAAGTLGYTLGSVGGWAIGVYAGRPYLERHGRWLHLGPERLERAERWFDRWGDATALLGRLTQAVGQPEQRDGGALVEQRFALGAARQLGAPEQQRALDRVGDEAGDRREWDQRTSAVSSLRPSWFVAATRST